MPQVPLSLYRVQIVVKRRAISKRNVGIGTIGTTVALGYEEFSCVRAPFSRPSLTEKGFGFGRMDTTATVIYILRKT